MNQQLRPNQKDALQKSIQNDFQSGIHYHATGSGKSWIAMLILEAFHKKYPNYNVLWICERKDILIQQFSSSILKERGFDTILKKYNLLEFVNYKDDKWTDSLNASRFWNKPYLCIINRSYLTTKEKYKLIKNPIHLVIHDECHSIENTTTQNFYDWLIHNHHKNNNIKSRIIGFSATPELIYPLDKYISTYSIYDAFLNKVILPPKILWLKSEKEMTQADLIYFIKLNIQKLPYQKIIVWCGMIEECLSVADKWHPYFPDYKLCLDFNNMSENNYQGKYKDFETFYQLHQKGILFCAVKHREGSDIPNIDGCIFMDKVEKRSERVFVQCMGRVLRKDKRNLKKYGLVIDLKAKSTIQICNRVQAYLKLRDLFPWKYDIQKLVLEDGIYFQNQLIMNEAKSIQEQESIQEAFKEDYTRPEIYSYFKRELPYEIKYQERLDYELNLITSKKLFGNMVRALEILELTKNIPHITRGSCGSSLVCYLLGISHMDPVKYNISFARFINQYRDTLPDIDFDFPHYLRDEVFLKLFQKWGHRVARISNHNYYHEKSALRESLRRNGIHKFISKYELQSEIKSYDSPFRKAILKTQKELEGEFKGYSLHCGGIIYFPNGIPEDKLLEGSDKTIIKQVNMNKMDVSEDKNFKIDILSSRGLTQLYYCHHFQDINFNQHIGDPKTIQLLSSGDNIGITLAETPLMKKALLLIKPKTIMDLAICLSIIRPAAKDAKKDFESGSRNPKNIIFDDDVISIISKLVGCDQEKADKLRRGYTKNKKESVQFIESYLKHKSKNQKKNILKVLNNVRKYSFCKAHALSYAQLVWQLAYQKAHHPKLFWKSTLKNVETCYRKWVHQYEAKCQGVSVSALQKGCRKFRPSSAFVLQVP